MGLREDIELVKGYFESQPSQQMSGRLQAAIDSVIGAAAQELTDYKFGHECVNWRTDTVVNIQRD